MKWFGRKSAGRSGARPALARGGSITSFGDWPRSYEAQVREGYCHNPVAQRAVKLVSEGVGSAPLKASDPALIALATARSGGQVLIETVAAQLLLHGRRWRGWISPYKARLSPPVSRRRRRVPRPGRAGCWAQRLRACGRDIRTRSRAGPAPDGFLSSRARACSSGSGRRRAMRAFRAAHGTSARSMEKFLSRETKWLAQGSIRSWNRRGG
jgi:hypothetical protein